MHLRSGRQSFLHACITRPIYCNTPWLQMCVRWRRWVGTATNAAVSMATIPHSTQLLPFWPSRRYPQAGSACGCYGMCVHNIYYDNIMHNTQCSGFQITTRTAMANICVRCYCWGHRMYDKIYWNVIIINYSWLGDFVDGHRYLASIKLIKKCIVSNCWNFL